MEKWAERLSELMKIKGVTQPDIVAATKLRQTSVRQWFTESPKPSTKMIMANNAVTVAKMVDTTVEYLITGKGDRESQAARFSDDTIDQAIDLIYLIRQFPGYAEDFERLNWPMIQIAAAAVERFEGNQEKIVGEFLSQLAKVRKDGT